MIAWSTIKPALVSLIAGIAVEPIVGAPAFVATWDDQPEFMSPDYRVRVTMKITNVSPKGWDQERREYSGGVFRTRVVGHRSFVLSISVECTEDTDTESVQHTVERIRMRLRRTSTIDALSAVGVSLIRTEPTAYPGAFRNHRNTGKAVLDIKFATVANDTEEVANWIETADVQPDQVGP